VLCKIIFTNKLDLFESTSALSSMVELITTVKKFIATALGCLSVKVNTCEISGRSVELLADIGSFPVGANATKLIER